MQEKKRGKGRVLMGLGLLLLAVAFVLALRLIKEERDADASAQKVLALMTASASPERTPSPVPDQTPLFTPQPTPSPTPKPLATPRRALFEINPDMEMPITVIENHEYIGILDFPVLELSLPVMSDWSYPKLKIAPCRYKGSAYTGDLIISGHNYERHFGRFSSMMLGDEIRFTDVDGNVFRYTVCAKETLDMRNVQGMLEGEWDMTLFTCVPGGAKRVTLRCRLEEYEIAPEKEKTANKQ
ncbi:MAG: sortase [Clostridia bacterium]|nr:sortase [Clostridia bacterium]